MKNNIFFKLKINQFYFTGNIKSVLQIKLHLIPCLTLNTD